MKYRPIIVDDTLQELTPHGTEEFPISMDEQIVNDSQCGAVEHWHYEIQICLVTKGAVVFRTPVEETLVQAGEGFFINSGVMHAPLPTDGQDNIYICVNFRPDLVYGASNSLIRKNYVDTILFNEEMRSFALKDEPWHRETCSLIGKLAEINDRQEYGYEIMMKVLVCQIWMLILVNNRNLVEKRAAATFYDQRRVQSLQKFIHQNYMENLSLGEIAGSVHISRGECCRVFKRVLGTTPISYLCKFRISQSMKLLTCTGLSISEIARQVGFESSSYFTERFKEELHCTPKEYRKQYKNAP